MLYLSIIAYLSGKIKTKIRLMSKFVQYAGNTHRITLFQQRNIIIFCALCLKIRKLPFCNKMKNQTFLLSLCTKNSC